MCAPSTLASFPCVITCYSYSRKIGRRIEKKVSLKLCICEYSRLPNKSTGALIWQISKGTSLFSNSHHYLQKKYTTTFICTTIYKRCTPLLSFAPLFTKEVHHYFNSHHYLKKKYTTTFIPTTI